MPSPSAVGARLAGECENVHRTRPHSRPATSSGCDIVAGPLRRGLLQRSIHNLCLLCLPLLFCAPFAVPADLRTVEVEREGDRYSLRSEAYFAASQDSLYRVLTNYDLFVQFSSAYVETRNVEADEQGHPGFFARMQGCVLFFCREFVRQGHLELTPTSKIVAIGDPEGSDFEYSRERWLLKPDGEGTLLIYDFEMEPGFWVPPIIGPYVIQRSLRADGTDAIDRIEALALGKTPKP